MMGVQSWAMGLERILIAQVLASLLLSSKSCSNVRRRVKPRIIPPLAQRSLRVSPGYCSKSDKNLFLGASRDVIEEVEVVPEVVFDQEYAVKESLEEEIGRGPVDPFSNPPSIIRPIPTLSAPQPSASAPAPLLCPPLSCSFANGYCHWHNPRNIVLFTFLQISVRTTDPSAFQPQGAVRFRLQNGKAMEGQEEALELQQELWDRLGWDRRSSFTYAIGTDANQAENATAEVRLPTNPIRNRRMLKTKERKQNL